MASRLKQGPASARRKQVSYRSGLQWPESLSAGVYPKYTRPCEIDRGEITLVPLNNYPGTVYKDRTGRCGGFWAVL